MENIMSFLNGNKLIEDFLKDLSDEIINCLNTFYKKAYMDGVISKITYERHPTFSHLLDYFINYGLTFSTKSSIYDFIYKIVINQKLTIKYYDKYKKDSILAIKAIPDYLDGKETNTFIEKEVFSKIPNGLSESNIIKYIKEECKRLFHIDGKKVPRWIQSAEWPLKSGTPCKFIKQRKNGEQVQYVFIDVISNEEIIIEQYY